MVYLCGLKTLLEFDIYVTAHALWCVVGEADREAISTQKIDLNIASY